MQICLLFALVPFFLSGQSSPPRAENETPHDRAFRMGVEVVADLNGGSPAYYYQGALSTPILRRAPVANVSADWKPWAKMPFLRLQCLLARHHSAFDEHISAFQLTGTAGGPDIRERITCELVQVGVGWQIESPKQKIITPYLRINFLMGFPQRLRYVLTHKNDNVPIPAFLEIADGTRISPGWKLGAGLRCRLLPKLSLQLGCNYIAQKVMVGWPRYPYRDFRGVVMRSHSAGLSLGTQVHW